MFKLQTLCSPSVECFERDKKRYPGQKTISGTKNDIRDKKRYQGQKTISGTTNDISVRYRFCGQPVCGPLSYMQNLDVCWMFEQFDSSRAQALARQRKRARVLHSCTCSQNPTNTSWNIAF